MNKKTKCIYLMLLAMILPLTVGAQTEYSPASISCAHGNHWNLRESGWHDNTDGRCNQMPPTKFIVINSANFPDDEFRKAILEGDGDNVSGGTQLYRVFMLDKEGDMAGRIPLEKNPKTTLIDGKEYVKYSNPNIQAKYGNWFGGKPCYYGGSTPREASADAYIDFGFKLKDFAADGILTAEELYLVNSLDLQGRNVTNLKGLEYFLGLQHVHRSPDWNYDFQPTLNIARTGISDLSTLTRVPLLKGLYCGGGQNTFTTLPTEFLTSLEYLSVYEVATLQTLDATKLTNLKHLNVQFCKNIQNLNLRNCPSLEVLICSNNELDELDVTQNENLVVIDCSTNKLKELDVTRNPKLNALYCSDNQLEELDLSKNSNIGQGAGYVNEGNHLWCDNNRLRVLNMDNITRDASPKLQNQKYGVNLSVVDNKYVGVKINFNVGNSTGETDFAQRFKRGSYYSPSVTMDGEKIDNPTVMTFGGESYLILAENPDDNSSDLNFHGKTLTYDYLARVNSSASMDATATTYPYIMNVKSLSKVTKGGETYYCGTIYLPYNAVVPANTEVYIATKIDKAPIHESNANQTAFETLNLVNVGVAGDVIPANTPLFVKTTNPGYFDFQDADKLRELDELPPYTLQTIPAGNIFKGTHTTIACSPFQYLTLSREQGIGTGVIGFWKYNGTTLSPYRVYIDANRLNDASSSKGVVFEFGDDNSVPTTIETVEAKKAGANVWYNTSGVRLSGEPTQPGVYICNGEKVVKR